MLFYTGDLFPLWRGNVFLIGSLTQRALVRVTIDGARVVGEEITPLGARIRDVGAGAGRRGLPANRPAERQCPAAAAASLIRAPGARPPRDHPATFQAM